VDPLNCTLNLTFSAQTIKFSTPGPLLPRAASVMQVNFMAPNKCFQPWTCFQQVRNWRQMPYNSLVIISLIRTKAIQF
jgi:hypothetical protein